MTVCRICLVDVTLHAQCPAPLVLVANSVALPPSKAFFGHGSYHQPNTTVPWKMQSKRIGLLTLGEPCEVSTIPACRWKLNRYNNRGLDGSARLVSPDLADFSKVQTSAVGPTVHLKTNLNQLEKPRFMQDP